MDMAWANTQILLSVHFTLNLSTKPVWGLSWTPSWKKWKSFFDLEACQLTCWWWNPARECLALFPLAKNACLLNFSLMSQNEKINFSEIRMGRKISKAPQLVIFFKFDTNIMVRLIIKYNESRGNFYLIVIHF